MTEKGLVDTYPPAFSVKSAGRNEPYVNHVGRSSLRRFGSNAAFAAATRPTELEFLFMSLDPLFRLGLIILLTDGPAPEQGGIVTRLVLLKVPPVKVPPAVRVEGP